MRLLTITLFLLLGFSLPAFATEEYAQKTGKACSACHLDPAGGGELTAAGKAYAASLAAGAAKGGVQQGAAPQVGGAARETGTSLLKKGVRLLVGYLHLLTAILWFGTILYVHLVLKPAYAAGGLPKGEVRVGVLSMIVMGVTGLILTHFRITSLDMLLHTRFGILLLAKISLYLVMVLAAIFVVIFIGPRLKGTKSGGAPVKSGELSADELAACDGKEGHPAYFACQGKVYDVSASRLWKQGVHMGRHNAGYDLTEALKLAPHDFEPIAKLRVVGDFAAAAPHQAPLHERVFYTLAYLNLSIVFVIVLIVSLWRWG